MIKHYFHRAPNPNKVQLFLEETGLANEIVPINIGKGDQHLPDFRIINPNGKVPAIVDTDGPDGKEVRVFDSTAILLYLAEKTGKLLGKKEDRPELLSWLFFVASGVGPYSGQAIHFAHVAPEQVPYAVNRYRREAERHYNVLDDHLEGRSYLVSDEFTIADISAWGWVDYAARVLGVAEDPLAPFPNVKRWLAAINARPAVARVNEVGKALAEKAPLGMDEATRRNLLPSNYPDLAAKWRKA